MEYLERLGVEVVFGLCGHTNIAVLDALSKSRIRFITSRHEQVSAHSADGYARVSGKPGVVLSHLGPGLTNCATGVANAALDSIPMVVIAGDIPSYYYGRHPHQEVNLHQDADQSQIFRPFCKRVYRVDRAADLPRIMERAFHLATNGRPGPVLVDIPMDFFSADLPVDAFSAGAGGDCPSRARSGDGRTDCRDARRGRAAADLRRRRRAVGARHRGARGAGRGARDPGRALADGQGLPARGSSAAARDDRLLGNAGRERQVPHRRRRSSPSAPGSQKRARARGIRGSRSRRRRPGSFTSMPTSPRSAATCRPSWASSPMRSSRSARSPTAAQGRAHRDRGPRPRGDSPRPARVLGGVGASVVVRPVPAAPRADSQRAPRRRFPKTASSSPTSAGTRTASRSSSRSPCPARSSRRAAWRRWGLARRPCSA